VSPEHREILGDLGAQFGLTADEVGALHIEDLAVLRSNLQHRLNRNMAILGELLPGAVDDFLAELFPPA
jgi:hypothetical protein